MKAYTVGLTLLGVLLSFAMQSDSATRSKLFIKRGFEFGFKSETVFTSPLMSTISCLAKCYSLDNCTAARIDGDVCTKGIGIQHVLEPGSSPYFEATKVFYIEGPGGKYSLTLIEARAQCEAAGTVLASPSDLLAARADGYEKCSCGWLANGIIGYVMQAPRAGCAFSTGIVYCSTANIKANAFCKTVIN